MPIARAMAVRQLGISRTGPIVLAPGCQAMVVLLHGTNPIAPTGPVSGVPLTVGHRHGINQTDPINPALVGLQAGGHPIGARLTGALLSGGHLTIGPTIIYGGVRSGSQD